MDNKRIYESPDCEMIQFALENSFLDTTSMMGCESFNEQSSYDGDWK